MRVVKDVLGRAVKLGGAINEDPDVEVLFRRPSVSVTENSLL